MGRWYKDKQGIMTYSPYRLKFYEEEKEIYDEAYSKTLSIYEAKIVFDKLNRHFKLNAFIRFKGIGGGKANRFCITLNYKPSFGLLCHEVAHLLDFKKRDKSKHDKKFMKLIGRIIKYCEKKNYWEKELSRRTAVKLPKPEPTKDELREKKLQKRKDDLERYKKKLRYYTKLYSNKIKKANRSIMMLERYKTNMR